MEMVATAGMLLLIRLISDPESAERMASVKALRQWIGAGPGAGFNAAFAALVGLVYLIKNVLRLMETYSQQRCAAATSLWVSSGLLERYLRAPYPMHLRRNSSELMTNVGSAADQLSWVVLQSATALISESMIALGILAVLIEQLSALARGAAAITAGVTILVLWITQRRHVRWGRRLHEAAIGKLQTLRQSLAAVKEAKVLGREHYFVERFALIRLALGRWEATQLTTEMVPRLAVETTFVLAFAALIIVSWLRTDVRGELTLTLGIFAYGGLRLLPSLHLIVYRFNRIGAGEAAVLAVAKDWNDLTPYVARGEPDAGAVKFEDRITFEQVSFSYDVQRESGDPSLHDISLEIRRGESVGIVGPTGSGKTTLVDLMLGLLEPTGGAVRVDGRDIRTATRSWQKQIGYVPQAVYLLDDTIRRNIALGLEDSEIDDSLIAESTRHAQLESFIQSLPQGLDTLVGERGAKLSGGERQRVAIARALYRRPSVLVFDEATAALDNVTEQALTATIQELHGVTRILIAHRLSTIEHCDRVIFLDRGRISGIGTYAELQRDAEFRAFSLAGTNAQPAPPDIAPSS